VGFPVRKLRGVISTDSAGRAAIPAQATHFLWCRMIKQGYPELSFDMGPVKGRSHSHSIDILPDIRFGFNEARGLDFTHIEVPDSKIMSVTVILPGDGGVGKLSLNTNVAAP
jgi:hypothetical protein